ncbi:MAG: DUF4926 domain-containing protein [Chloroflexaceae bacterium]|nr:DUF4926 domain-containing protein [Chloroflexaceae bacterium]
MIEEHDSVILMTDVPEHGLQAGDLGTVVMVAQQGKGYIVEFMTLDGETIAVVSLFAEQVRPIEQGEIAHARMIAPVPVSD